MVRLKIQTGRRQTSIHKRGRGVELGTIKNNPSLVVRDAALLRLSSYKVPLSTHTFLSSPQLNPPARFFPQSTLHITLLRTVLPQFPCPPPHAPPPPPPIYSPDQTYLLHLWSLF